MKPGVHLLAGLVSVALCAAARAQDGFAGGDPPPPTGMDYLASGGALAGIGVLSFASSPICKSGVVSAGNQNACFSTSFLAGTPFLVLGIPLIVYGVVQRGKYEEWAKRHPTVSGLRLSPAAGGGAVAWGATF